MCCCCQGERRADEECSADLELKHSRKETTGQTDSNAASLGVANSIVTSDGRRSQQAYRDAQSSLPGAHRRKRIFSVLQAVGNSNTVSSPKY